MYKLYYFTLIKVIMCPTAMSEFSCIKTAALTVGVVVGNPPTNFNIVLGDR